MHEGYYKHFVIAESTRDHSLRNGLRTDSTLSGRITLHKDCLPSNATKPNKTTNKTGGKIIKTTTTAHSHSVFFTY